MLIEPLYIISWKELDAFEWPFLAPVKSFTLGMNRMNDESFIGNESFK